MIGSREDHFDDTDETPVFGTNVDYAARNYVVGNDWFGHTIVMIDSSPCVVILSADGGSYCIAIHRLPSFLEYRWLQRRSTIGWDL